MKVAIVNCYDDSNKGSSAILWGLIRRLQSTGLVQTISLVSMFPEEHSLYKLAFRHIQAGFPSMVTVGAPLISSLESVTNAHKKISGVRGYSARLGSALGAALKLRLCTRGQALAHPSFHEIITSDLVLDRGGPFFVAGNRVFNLSLYGFAYPLLVARKFGVPFGFAPGSDGPFVSRWSRRLVRHLFNEAALVMVRDQTSHEELVACGVSPERISLTLDSAFWVEPCLSPRVKQVMQVRGLEPGQFLAVTTRRWYKQHQQRYHRELAETIDSLVPQYFRKAVLVANMVDPREQIADDRQTTRELFELIQHKEHVSTLDDDLRPDELVSLYGQSQLVLGTRLHSAIMALSSGTPVLAVSYAGHKTHGLMQLVGFPQYTLNLETFCKAAAVPLVLSALSTREALGARIAELRQQGDDDFQAAFNHCRAFSQAT